MNRRRIVLRTTGQDCGSPGGVRRKPPRRGSGSPCEEFDLIDIVTHRRANLHNDTMRLLQAPPEVDFPAGVELYAAAYRPVLRQERPEIDLWNAVCGVGQPLPVMPLRLTGDLFVPVDFEAAYLETCRRRRLI
jgi:hypothetical protein